MDYTDFDTDDQYQQMRAMIDAHNAENDMADFEEQMQLNSVREVTRIWYEDGIMAGFAFVDDFCNLWFKIAPGQPNLELENEIVDWAVQVMRERNRKNGENATLDASCSGSNEERIQFLELHGFSQTEERSLYYSRSLDKPITPFPFPQGYTRRVVKGETEVEDLVRLFQAAVGTEKMTFEYRLAMMRTSEYRPDLDWVAVSPKGNLAAYCIGGFDEAGSEIAYLDPVGTHPKHQHKGLGAAMMTAGLIDLKECGAKTVQFGTSSKNIPMQKLGEAVGFELVGEHVWFSKKVD